jgi:hypothetical protein
MLATQVLHLRHELMDAQAEAERQLAVMKRHLGCMSNNVYRLTNRPAIVRRGGAVTGQGTLVAVPTVEANHASIFGVRGGSDDMDDPSLPHPTAPATSTIPTATELDASALQPLSTRLLTQLHKNPHNLPEVPPAYTLGACEKRTQFDNLKLHKIFDCQKFRSQSHLVTASCNYSLINTGDFPDTLGDFATLTQPARRKPI